MSEARLSVDAETAERFVETSDFLWHQIFDLGAGVETPGVNSVEGLFLTAEIEADLTGLSVLDIGTTNGGAAFEAERRGAARVVAVDVFDEHRFGFAALRELLGSNAEFVQSNVYELPEALGGEQFDLVFFWGVLYHLRHPLLALDCVRKVARDRVMVETAIADHELDPTLHDSRLSRFYRRDELGADPTNWFAPTGALLADWCESCGMTVEKLTRWPDDRPTRGHTSCRIVDEVPEWSVLCFEGTVQATVQSHWLP